MTGWHGKKRQRVHSTEKDKVHRLDWSDSKNGNAAPLVSPLVICTAPALRRLGLVGPAVTVPETRS